MCQPSVLLHVIEHLLEAKAKQCREEENEIGMGD